MRDQFDMLIDEIATEYMAKGEGSGGASKILSGLLFPILTILAVQLIQDAQYIPLLILGAFIWTNFAVYVLLSGLIYFLVTKYWVGSAIIVAYFVVTGLSIYLGKRNIRRLFLSGKPMISPFETMPDLLLILVLECLFLAAAMLTHGWISAVFWTLLGLVALHQFGRYWFRLRPRWSQIHQPLMIRYAGCAGHEVSQAQNDGREFDFLAATRSLLKTVYPRRQDEELDTILSTASEKMLSFSDRGLLTQTIHKKNPSIPQSTVDEVLRKVEAHLKTEEGRKLIIRYAIAEIVESVFGEDERGDYLLSVIEGRAK